MRQPLVAALGALLLLPGVATASAAATQTELEAAMQAYYFGEWDDALRQLGALAERGCAKAQAKYASMYDRPLKDGGDPRLALKWYRQAAANGNAEAQFALGFAYDAGMWGLGPREFEKARTWYVRAAEQGDPYAMRELGVLYLYGRGVERSLVEAYKWHLLAIPRFPPPTTRPAYGLNTDHQARENLRQLIAQYLAAMTSEEVASARAKAEAWEQERGKIRHMPERSDEPVPLWTDAIEGPCEG